MHKEKLKYRGKIIEVDTFDTKVHLNRGRKHAISDIDRLLKEEARYKKTGKIRPAKKGIVETIQ